jgi:hypothetical protein
VGPQGPIAVPEHVERELATRDSRLTFAWNPKMRRYEALYLRTGKPQPPYVFHPITGQRHGYYAMVMPILTDGGAARAPATGDIYKLIEMDTWSRYARPEDFGHELMQSYDRWESSRKKEQLDRIEETFTKPVYGGFVERRTFGYSGHQRWSLG